MHIQVGAVDMHIQIGAVGFSNYQSCLHLTTNSNFYRICSGLVAYAITLTGDRLRS